MFTRMRRAILAAAIVAVLPAAANAYTLGRCAAETEAAFDRLHLDRSKIERAITDVERANVEASQISGVNVWLKTAACHGSLIVVLGGDCRFIDTYTTGDCSLGDFRR